MKAYENCLLLTLPPCACLCCPQPGLTPRPALPPLGLAVCPREAVLFVCPRAQPHPAVASGSKARGTPNSKHFPEGAGALRSMLLIHFCSGGPRPYGADSRSFAFASRLLRSTSCMNSPSFPHFLIRDYLEDFEKFLILKSCCCEHVHVLQVRAFKFLQHVFVEATFLGRNTKFIKYQQISSQRGCNNVYSHQQGILTLHLCTLLALPAFKIVDIFIRGLF